MWDRDKAHRINDSPGILDLVCQDLSELRGRTTQATNDSELARNPVLGKARNYEMVLRIRYAYEVRSVDLPIEPE